MNEESKDLHNWDELSQQEREAVTNNILVIELLLENLVSDTTEHLGFTHSNCLKSCIGEPALELLNTFDERVLHMALTLAVRHLAEQRYQAKENVS